MASTRKPSTPLSSQKRNIFCRIEKKTNYFPILGFNFRKRTFGHVRPAKIQIGPCFRTVWLEPSQDAFWIAKDAQFLHADSEDSNQADLNVRWAHMSDGSFSPVVDSYHPAHHPAHVHAQGDVNPHILRMRALGYIAAWRSDEWSKKKQSYRNQDTKKFFLYFPSKTYVLAFGFAMELSCRRTIVMFA